MNRLTAARALVACTCLLSGVAVAGTATADATTRSLLRDAEFQQIRISPDGNLLAIARHLDGKTSVTLHKRADMAPVISFDPGTRGEINELYWIDDKRLLIEAERINPVYGLATLDPAMMIVNVDGRDPFVLPGNFVGTIKDDPDHILVGTCAFATATSGCKIPEIRKSNIRRLTKRGELISSGPAETGLISDRRGRARFAIGWEDDGTSKAYVFDQASSTWALLNDGAVSGVEIIPISVADDGLTGLLQSQRKQGTDVIERYEFATGKRTEILGDAGSDPFNLHRSVDRRRVIGAVYDPTQPTVRMFDPEDPDAKLGLELQAAFPGKIAQVTSASENGDFSVVTVFSDREPGAFYLFDRKAKKASVIARMKPWLDAARQGPQRGFRFVSRDGLAIHGVLTLPPGGAGTNLPMVVLPHGGPYEVTEVWGFDSEAQILAQHGYAVLQVNFRGSGGYGRQFTDLGTRQWGRAMQDDVTDATKWAIEQGIADARRICIYGASYGGYAALMGTIREPAMYRCAVGRSGVFDLSKMYKWGSIRRSDFGKLYLKRVLGEDMAELSANSPAALADRISVPVLLAHGVLDSRVDIKHAQLMARELKKRKHPVELVEYSATGHHLILNRHLEDFYARLLAFLDANTR